MANQHITRIRKYNINSDLKKLEKMSNNKKDDDEVNDKPLYDNDDTSLAIEALMAMGKRSSSPSTTITDVKQSNNKRKRDNSIDDGLLDSPSSKKQDIKMNKGNSEVNNSILSINTNNNNNNDNVSNYKNTNKNNQIVEAKNKEEIIGPSSSLENENNNELINNEIKVTKLMIIEKMNKEIEVLKSAIQVHKSIDPEGKLPLILPKKEGEDNNNSNTSNSKMIRNKNNALITKTARNNSRGSYRCKLCNSFKKQHVCKGNNAFYFYNHVNIQTDCSSIIPYKDRDTKVSMKSGRVLTVSIGPYKECATH